MYYRCYDVRKNRLYMRKLPLDPFGKTMPSVARWRTAVDLAGDSIPLLLGSGPVRVMLESFQISALSARPAAALAGLFDPAQCAPCLLPTIHTADGETAETKYQHAQRCAVSLGCPIVLASSSGTPPQSVFVFQPDHLLRAVLFVSRQLSRRTLLGDVVHVLC
jgi:hypothetical protein